MPQTFSWDRFDDLPVVGILRGFEPELTFELAAEAANAGLTCLEVTMNTPEAAETIAELDHQLGDRLNIGAGTVTSVRELDDALGAGASYIVTPVVLPEVIAACVAQGVPVFPGAFTPTEVFQAWQAGAKMIKLFPAQQGGPSYLKAIKGPLNQVKLLATGGVNLDNLDAWLDAGADGFGVGSPLFQIERMRARDWPWLREQIAGFRTIIHARL